MEEVEEAHDVGLSYGKYKAYLKIKSLDPDITLEQVQEMTMKEIHDLIHSLSNNNQNDTDADQHGHQGSHHGHHGHK